MMYVKSVSVLTLLMTTACATNTLSDAENAYGIAITAANGIKSQCQPMPATDPCHALVMKLQGLDQKAYTVLVMARTNKDLVAAALAAVNDFKSATGAK